MSKSIPYGRQNITEEDLRTVVETLQSDYLTQGPAIAKFEKEFAEYIGCKYAVAVSNGTAALHLAAMALGVKKGSRIITTPITFAASANCIKYCEGEVYFADIDPQTFTLDPAKVEELINSKPAGYFSGIVPVDFAGHAVDLEKFRSIADKHGLWILEDACHAPGGFFTDSKGIKQNCGNGSYAELAIFSFHPVKHIATGEGGMITTNDQELYKKLLTLRTHGITRDASIFRNSLAVAQGLPEAVGSDYPGWYMEMQELGYNYRITDFQAALGSSQLKRADDGVAIRRTIASIYAEAFKEHPAFVGKSQVLAGHAYHLFVILTRDRLGLYNYLRTKNIFAQVHYIPVHLMPYYQEQGFKKGDFPIAENYYDHCLSLPMFPTLSSGDQDFVIQCIKDYFS